MEYIVKTETKTLLKRSSDRVHLYSKMTVTDKVKESIVAWGDAPRQLTWSFLFLIVIIGFFLAGFCSDHWLESSIVVSGYEYRSQGLWRFCNESLGTTCCGYINDLMYIERKLSPISFYRDYEYATILVMLFETIRNLLNLNIDACVFCFQLL